MYEYTPLFIVDDTAVQVNCQSTNAFAVYGKRKNLWRQAATQHFAARLSRGVDIMLFTQTLKKNFMFRYVYNRGRSIANRNLVMYVYRNGKNYNRIGYSVSKKVGNSVVRSRVTRLLRESYRLTEERVSRGYDIVVIARASICGLPFAEVDRSLKHLLKKQNIYN